MATGRLVFKREKDGNLKNMPYIDVCDVTEAFTHVNIKAIQEKKIQMIRMNMK